MQHNIPVDQLTKEIGPQIVGMVTAIESCVHCGFCLPTCPTYKVLNDEMDSPRGRILLMKSVLEGSLPIRDAMPYIDLCLGCLACVTACPSGVQYDELVEPFKVYAENGAHHSLMDSAQGFLVRETLPYPDRFRIAATVGKLAQPLKGILPGEMRSMLELLPAKMQTSRPLPEFVPAEGKRRARVALLSGCVQQVIDAEINWATIRVLSRNGVDVVIPRDQNCCGAILMHAGDYDGARELAAHNLDVFPDDVDFVLTNAAGCGAGMKAYGTLFQGLDKETYARKFASRVRDISEFLLELGIMPPQPLATPKKVAYHDACHLKHAQKIADAPRQLLGAIANLELLEIEDGDICCGSAGTYNIEHPEIASQLGRMKAENILNSGAEMAVMGNIGCEVQIRKYLDGRLPVYHTIQVLDMAYGGERWG